MNKYSFLILSLFATQAYASICEVNMVDTYSGRILNRFREYDYDGTCREAMKECRKQIRLSGWYGRADCQISRAPSPAPVPTPAPDYSSDARRQLRIGEVVIFNNQFATIIRAEGVNLYSVQYKNDRRSTHHQIPREYLAVTDGCLNSQYQDLCTGHQVITPYNEYATVVGIHYNQKVVLRLNNRSNYLESNVEPSDLVITR